MEKLLGVLEEIRPDVDFRNSEKLVSGGYIDSFDIVSIINTVEEEYRIDIPVESILPENFESARALMMLIDSLKTPDTGKIMN